MDREREMPILTNVEKEVLDRVIEHSDKRSRVNPYGIAVGGNLKNEIIFESVQDGWYVEGGQLRSLKPAIDKFWDKYIK